MTALKTVGKYEVSDEIKAEITSKFFGGFCNDEQTKATIKALFDTDKYLCDTHTAVAVNVYEQYVEQTGDTTPSVIASTASPYKFTRSVMNAIDPEYDSKTDFELVDELEKLSGVKVPQAIEDIRSAKVLHDTVCDKEDMLAEVKGFLNI